MPPSDNPFYREPLHPNFNRRALHHDYRLPAKYMLTILKNPDLPPFSQIIGDPKSIADIQILLSPLGEAIQKAIEEWIPLYPIYVPTHIIMPDHIHICVDVIATLDKGLSRAVSRLMGKCSSIYHHSLPDRLRPEKMTPLFTTGFNDKIAYTEERWKREKNYTNDNPRRYLIKKHYPDYLRKRWLLTVSGDRQFVMMGNIFLLKMPHLFRVKTSRHYTAREAIAAMEQWKRELFNGGIPISPFIHPHEKELKNRAIQEGYSFIRICTHGFAERAAPTGIEFELMSEGRLLLIGQPEYSTRKEDLRYSFAQNLNDLAKEIADTGNRGVSLTIRPL